MSLPVSSEGEEELLQLLLAHRLVGVAGQALPHGACNDLEAGPVQCPRHRCQLDDHVGAVATALDHRNDAGELALGAAEPAQHGVGGLLVYLHRLVLPGRPPERAADRPLICGYTVAGPLASASSAILARTASISMSRAWLMSCSSACSGSAPGCAYSTTLSRMIISVGIDEMLNPPASAGSASVSTLPKTTSGYRSDTRSKTGPNMRHGPHHAAQKSMRTRPPPSTTDSKFSAVSSCVAMFSPS